MKYLELLTRAVEQRISQELPNHFGIMLDGWTNLLEFTLQVFKKQMEDILFFVCDNDSVNKSIAKKLELPMIGCNSHRLNLALKKLMEPHEGLLQKVQNLMKKLLSLKKSAVLRKKTELRPVLRNDTR